MSLFKISEKFVLNKLKSIRKGNLKLVNYDGKVYHFGDLENPFSADIKIINPNFFFRLPFPTSLSVSVMLCNKFLPNVHMEEPYQFLHHNLQQQPLGHHQHDV